MLCDHVIKQIFLTYRCHSRSSPSAFWTRVSRRPETTTINFSIFLRINETSAFFDGISRPFNILNSPEDTSNIEFLFLARRFAYIASRPFMSSTLYANTPRNKQIVFCVEAPEQSLVLMTSHDEALPDKQEIKNNLRRDSRCKNSY